ALPICGRAVVLGGAAGLPVADARRGVPAARQERTRARPRQPGAGPCAPRGGTAMQHREGTGSAEAAGDVVLRGLDRRVGEDALGVVDLDQLAGLADRG